MAKSRRWDGMINKDYYIDLINKAQNNNDAIEVLRSAMQDTTKGIFNIGVTDKDQRVITDILNAYNNKFKNPHIQGALDIWDPDSNHINSAELKGAIGDALYKLKQPGNSEGYLDNKQIEENLKKDPDLIDKIINGSGGGSASIGGGKPSGGGGGTSRPSTGGGSNITINYTPPKAEKVNWQGRDVNEVADQIGIKNYKYEDILKIYDDATNKKFDEYDTQVKRAQANNLRTLENTYDSYLNQIRANRANAVASGMTKGTEAANQILTMLGNADVINQTQEGLNNTLYDIAQQRGTALEQDRVNAHQQSLAFQQYMGNLLGTYEANSVNELAARLAQQGQIEAARIAANAQRDAAGIAADASRDAAGIAAAGGGGGRYGNNDVYALYKALYGPVEGTKRYVQQIERPARSDEMYKNYQVNQ